MESGPLIKAKLIIKDGIALLPDDEKAGWKASASDIFINEAIDAARMELLYSVSRDTPEMHNEKEAMLTAYAVQEANRMASTLWRLELLTKDLEDRYRSLPSMTEIVKPYNEFLKARQERTDQLAENGEKLQQEKRELDIFMGIINGIPAEESEKRYEQFKNAQQSALGGAS